MMAKNNPPMKVSRKFKELVVNMKKKTGKNMTDITDDIANSIELMKMKNKKIRKQLIEEISF